MGNSSTKYADFEAHYQICEIESDKVPFATDAGQVVNCKRYELGLQKNDTGKQSIERAFEEYEEDSRNLGGDNQKIIDDFKITNSKELEPVLKFGPSINFYVSGNDDIVGVEYEYEKTHISTLSFKNSTLQSVNHFGITLESVGLESNIIRERVIIPNDSITDITLRDVLSIVFKKLNLNHDHLKKLEKIEKINSHHGDIILLFYHGSKLNKMQYISSLGEENICIPLTSDTSETASCCPVASLTILYDKLSEPNQALICNTTNNCQHRPTQCTKTDETSKTNHAMLYVAVIVATIVVIFLILLFIRRRRRRSIKKAVL